MRRVIAMCGILMVLFALGAFAQGYAEGYEDGKAAVVEVVRTANFATLAGGIFYTVPTELMEGIKDMPESYQEGYVMGYKDGAMTAFMQPSPGMLNYWLVTALIVVVGMIAFYLIIFSI